jgi:CRISPR-associated protein Csx10
MHKIKLTITALSPLAIGRKKPGSVSEASDYIPGSVIRGAIACELIKRSEESEQLPSPKNNFYSLFLEDNAAIFSNAYPAVTKVKNQQGKEDRIIAEDIRVLPATAVSSKVNPGFTTTNGNGVFDTLIDNFCAKACDRVYDPSCSKAIEDKQDSKLEPFTGFYSRSKEDRYYSYSVSKRLLTRVGINRRRATSEEEILYNIEVLNEKFSIKESHELTKWQDAIYKASIFIESDLDLVNKLTNFIETNDRSFSLGGSVSRGLGRVKIKAEAEKIECDLTQKIDRFNKILKDRWQEWNVFGEPSKDSIGDRTFFTINLEADAILTENWRRTTVISPEMLCQFANLETEELKQDLHLHTAYNSYDYLSGWNSAWGFMKDVELITIKGSVYLFSISTNKINTWIEALNKLKMQGVGERTSEGFGQIEICSEFHQIVRGNAK